MQTAAAPHNEHLKLGEPAPETEATGGAPVGRRDPPGEDAEGCRQARMRGMSAAGRDQLAAAATPLASAASRSSYESSDDEV